MKIILSEIYTHTKYEHALFISWVCVNNNLKITLKFFASQPNSIFSDQKDIMSNIH